VFDGHPSPFVRAHLDDESGVINVVVSRGCLIRHRTGAPLPLHDAPKITQLHDAPKITQLSSDRGRSADDARMSSAVGSMRRRLQRVPCRLSV